MKVVIMAGGSGTRFWPRSHQAKPKQFLALTSDKSMLQETYQRFARWVEPENIYVLTTGPYRSLVEEQLPVLKPGQLIIEPGRKDTGPCIALMASHFIRRGDDEVLVTAPSDQHISDWQALRDTLLQAEQVAASGHNIVTLGIQPTRPETGFGYIQAVPSESNDPVLPVVRFIEKPPLDVAKELLRHPGYYWNSGMFVWRPSTIAHYMQAFQPVIWQAVNLSGEEREQAYRALVPISVDYAILERVSGNLYVIPATFEWDDVGTWTALERVYKPDADGNVLLGDVRVHSTVNSIVYADKRKTVVMGVRDLIIVSTDEGVLVCHKSEEAKLKTLLKDE